MYTQVTFGLFLERLTEKTKEVHGIEFGEYPNIAIQRFRGDWVMETLNNFTVRIFRWGIPGCEVEVKGPNWDDTSETAETFEPRFEQDFTAAIDKLIACKSD